MKINIIDVVRSTCSDCIYTQKVIQIYKKMNRFISKYFFYYPATLLKGEFVGKYLSQYRSFQYKSRDEIQSYQLVHLKRLLEYASKHSEYYKKSFEYEGVKPSDLQRLDDLNKFPFLSKNDLATKKEILSTTNKSIWTTQKTTGGSTGQAVTILKNVDALARERAATWTAYEWANISIGDPQARFWGSPLHQSQQFKYKIIDLISNRMRLSAFEVNNSRLEEYYQKLLQFKPVYLYGYVSIIEAFAKFMQERNYKLPSSVKSIITTSEVLTDNIRQTIEAAFHLKVFNEYGCGEVGSIAHECEHGSMHVLDENIIVEVETGINHSDEGEIIVTDLHNYVMPIIRYRLGDYASITNKTCLCGRTLKVLGNIHGRAYDCIFTKEGKMYHPEIVMYIFEDIKNRMGGVSQFQVIQESTDNVLVKIVKSNNYFPDIENHISNEFKDKLSPSITTRFEYVNSIERETSGKLRLVKSNLNNLHEYP